MKTFKIADQVAKLNRSGFKEIISVDGIQKDVVKGEPVKLQVFRNLASRKSFLTYQYHDGSGFVFESLKNDLKTV